MFIIAAILTFGLPNCLGQKNSPLRQISTEDLQSSVKIIGPLGIEIGKLVEIEAVPNTDEGKLATTWLSVEKVAGKELPKPIRVDYAVYNWANVKRLEDGKRVKLNVFQEIGMRGIPDGVIEQTVSVATVSGYGLHTWIVVVNQTSPKPSKHRNKYYDSLRGGHPLEKRVQKK